MYNKCETDFNLDPHLIMFLSKTPFFTEISRNIRKVPTKEIPTMAISFNVKNDELALLWNPDFVSKLTDWQIQNVLTHEFYHVVFSHVQTRRKTPDRMWNIATDLAINSLIVKGAEEHGAPTGFNEKDGPLPKGCLIPGEWPVYPDGREMSKEEKDAAPIAALLAKLPHGKASEYYFHRLAEVVSKMSCPVCGKSNSQSKQKNPGELSDPEDEKQSGQGDQSGTSAPGAEGQQGDQEQSGCSGKHGPGPGEHSHDQGGGSSQGGQEEKQQGQGQGSQSGDQGDNGESQGGGQDQGESDEPCPACGNADSWIDSFDNHASWDNVPEEQREMVNARVRNVIAKAVSKADQNADGWGSIPKELRESIRRSVSNIVNWRSVLKQFVGHMIRGSRSTSIKRINKRYPYIHPGIQKGYTAKLLIAIDMSGSVDNGMLEMFFAELSSLTKKVTIDVLPFDCSADVKDIFTWRKGQSIETKRLKQGGTDFNAPTGIVNDPKNRGRWDGMLIMTDGECFAPVSSRVKRGWILGQGQKLQFNSNELTIQLDDGKTFAHGAWH